MSKLYTFKRVIDERELESCFRFRYETYANSIQHVFLSERDDRIDIDRFDVHSKHHGLYCGAELVGYVRTVHPPGEFINYSVLAIAEKYSYSNDKSGIGETRDAPYPFLSYAGVPASLWDYYNGLAHNKEGIIEVSRLMIAPEHQGLRTSKFLIEASFVLFNEYANGRQHVVVDCFEKHSAFYIRYGFRPINATSYHLFGQANTTLTIPKTNCFTSPTASGDLHSTINAMVMELRETGKIQRMIADVGSKTGDRVLVPA